MKVTAILIYSISRPQIIEIAHVSGIFLKFKSFTRARSVVSSHFGSSSSS
jgi:hypothetical protein